MAKNSDIQNPNIDTKKNNFYEDKLKKDDVKSDADHEAAETKRVEEADKFVKDQQIAKNNQFKNAQDDAANFHKRGTVDSSEFESRETAEEITPDSKPIILDDLSKQPISQAEFENVRGQDGSVLNLNSKAGDINEQIDFANDPTKMRSANINANPVNTLEVIYKSSQDKIEKANAVISDKSMVQLNNAIQIANHSGNAALGADLHNAMVALGDLRQNLINVSQAACDKIQEVLRNG